MSEDTQAARTATMGEITPEERRLWDRFNDTLRAIRDAEPDLAHDLVETLKAIDGLYEERKALLRAK